MSRIHAYEREPYRRTLDTEVLSIGEDGGRPWAVLADTVLFPEGGGQPADHGRLKAGSSEVAVVDVRKTDGELRHVLDGPVVPGPATVAVDWTRRFDHMQQHTAQHLLTATALDRFGWRTTAFHLQPEVCDIELDVADPAPADLEALEDAVAAEIRAARPVTARRVRPDEVVALGVRSRGLPAGHEGDVRLVEIAGIDLNTCGGTHVAATSEIEAVKLLGCESIRGGTRLFWIAGARIRRRLGRHEERAAALRRVLDTGDDQLAEIAALKLEQLKDVQRREKALVQRLAELAATALASGDGPVAEAHFDDVDAGFLGRVARGFVAARESGIALLTASGVGGSYFVVAAGAAAGLDLAGVGPRVAEILQGRGGGAGGVFQGKAGSLAERGRAVDLLRRAGAGAAAG